EVDLVAVDVDPPPRQGVGDVLRRDRAVELAALADLDAHREGGGRDPGCRDVGFLALPLPLVLAAGDVVLPGAVGAAGGRHRDSLRNEEVRGEAVGHLLHFAALAELVDVLGQDDLHAIGSSLLIHSRTRGAIPDCWSAAPAWANSSGMRRIVLRTGLGVNRRIRAMSSSKATRSMSSSASFSARSSSGTPSRNRSMARTTTTRSSRPPRSGISSGIRSRPMSTYPAAPARNAFRAAGVRSSTISDSIRRAYTARRPARGMNAIRPRARPSVFDRRFEPLSFR